MSGQSRINLHVTSEHQNIDEIAISKPDLKIINFEKLLFHKSQNLMYVEGFSCFLLVSKTCNIMLIAKIAT